MENLPGAEQSQLVLLEAASEPRDYRHEKPRPEEYAGVNFTTRVVYAEKFIAGNDYHDVHQTTVSVRPRVPTPNAPPASSPAPRRQLTAAEETALQQRRHEKQARRERREQCRRQSRAIIKSESIPGVAECTLVAASEDDLAAARMNDGSAAAAMDVNRIKLLTPPTQPKEYYTATIVREPFYITKYTPPGVYRQQEVPAGSIKIVHGGKVSREVPAGPGEKTIITDKVNESVYISPTVREEILAENPASPADEAALTAREARQTARANRAKGWKKAALLIPLGVCALASTIGIGLGLLETGGPSISGQTPSSPEVPHVGSTTPSVTPEKPLVPSGNQRETCSKITATETHNIQPGEEMWLDVRTQLLRLKPGLAKNEKALDRATKAWILADENLNHFPDYRELRPGDPMTLYTDNGIKAFYDLLSSPPSAFAPAEDKRAWKDAQEAWRVLVGANVTGEQIDFRNQASSRADIKAAAAIVNGEVKRLIKQNNDRCAHAAGRISLSVVFQSDASRLNRAQRREM